MKIIFNTNLEYLKTLVNDFKENDINTINIKTELTEEIKIYLFSFYSEKRAFELLEKIEEKIFKNFRHIKNVKIFEDSKNVFLVINNKKYLL